jgi:shikimate dehydrogenase
VSNPAIQDIVSCMGQPVAGNPTQFMMERAFAAAGLEWRYLTLEVSPAQLPDAVRGMRAMGFRGGNFTIPHKVAVVPLLDGLTPSAELMGAVNCVYRQTN